MGRDGYVCVRKLFGGEWGGDFDDRLDVFKKGVHMPAGPPRPGADPADLLATRGGPRARIGFVSSLDVVFGYRGSGRCRGRPTTSRGTSLLAHVHAGTKWQRPLG